MRVWSKDTKRERRNSCDQSGSINRPLALRRVVERSRGWPKRNRLLAKGIEQIIASATAGLFVESIQLFHSPPRKAMN